MTMILIKQENERFTQENKRNERTLRHVHSFFLFRILIFKWDRKDEGTSYIFLTLNRNFSSQLMS